MQLTGKETIAQPVQRVWDCLNDPEILKACLAGCEEISRAGDNTYKVVLNASVGPVKARFNGKLLLSDLDPPNSYALTFEGTGGAAGFAKGNAKVRLTPEGEATRLDYTAEAKIGGKIAQVGSRLIDGVAGKIAADFFARFKNLVAVSEPAPESLAAATPEPAGLQPNAPVAPAATPSIIRATTVVLAIAALLALFFLLRH
jgi:hypothetical protein